MESTELNYPAAEVADYYEFLQISPSASTEAIHRIYRFWAARYHPDNPATGNDELFYRVRTAYDILSDPQRRAQYDAMRSRPASPPSNPLSSIVDFMDEVEGETNRRLALLAILYSQRRANPRYPEVSLRDLEAILGFPREYLDFTTWYLVQKHYMFRADNSDFTITVAGVDYVEAQRPHTPALNRLLSSGKLRLAEFTVERRLNMSDRRMGLPDTRAVKVERRVSKRDRRALSSNLRLEDFGANNDN
jgi:curved DNA-binding protein CbpA